MTIDVFEVDPVMPPAAQRPETASEKLAFFLDTAPPVQIGMIAFTLLALAYVAIYVIYRRRRR